MSNAAPATPPATQAILDPARFAEICEALRKVIQRGVEQRGAAYNRAAGPMLWLIWGRLSRLARRFRRLSEKLAAGTLKPPRSRPSRSRKATPPPAPAAAQDPAPENPASGNPAQPAPAPHTPAPPRMPRRRLWPVRVMQDLAVGGSWLRILLADPETAALVAAAPQTGRLIRPLCHMFGVELPSYLQRPRWPRARPAAPEAKPKVKAKAAPPATPTRAARSPAIAAPPLPGTHPSAPTPPDTG